MKKQSGAALIVVLSLMTISLMVGLSSMQSSQLDERLAGNYKAQSQAQMGAETAASEGYRFMIDSLEKDDIDLDLDEFFDEKIKDEFDWSGFLNFESKDVANALEKVEESVLELLLGSGKDETALGDGGCSGNVKCEYRFLELDESNSYDKPAGYYIVGMGSVFEGASGSGDLYAVSEPVFVRLLPAPDFPDLPDLKPITLLGELGSFTVNGGNKEWIKSADSDDASVAVSSDKEVVEDALRNNSFESPSVEVDKYFDDVSGFKDFLEFAKSLNGYKGKVHYVDEDPDMKKYTDGILIVNSSFTWNGKADFSGVILVLGDSVTYNGGGSGKLNGALVHAPIADLGADSWSKLLGNSNLTFNGLGDFTFSYNKDALESIDAVIRNAPPAIGAWE